MIKKLYAKRNAKTQGEIYIDHIYAMNREGLHIRVDIAAELAHRDIRIKKLLTTISRLKNEISTN